MTSDREKNSQIETVIIYSKEQEAKSMHRRTHSDLTIYIAKSDQA